MDWNKLYQRFQRYKKAYFKSAFGGRQTGDGVDPAEGDDRYDDKEERMCPGFAHLHAMFKNNPHLHPACEVQMANGQLHIGLRAGEMFLGSADEPDEHDTVYISDEDQDLEEEENSGGRPTAVRKGKGKKVDDDVVQGAGLKCHKHSGQSFQCHHSHSPAASMLTRSSVKRG
jgi:hypothetical protein